MPRAALLLVVLAGCGSHASTKLLCAFCEIDAHCGGNPCFADVSDQRFCGYPCELGCPDGYSCQIVTGTAGQPVRTCFPDLEACRLPSQLGPDLAVPVEPRDLGGLMLDFAMPRAPVGGPIGVTGGQVARLRFGFTGDTRPTACDGPYPQAIIDNIFRRMRARDVQFVVDQGDHMFNCLGGYAGAAAQMNAYFAAAALVERTVFMTFGNHECTGSRTALCSTATSYQNNTNYTAYVDSLKRMGLELPYYRFDVATGAGLAVFIVIADDAWDATQEAWLESQLADADQRARYTFVSKHHPDRNDDHPQFQAIYDQVRRHKYTLFLTGHSHLYKRQFSDPRALVVGTGGAPLAGGTFFGYGVAEQGADDNITVTVYDQANDAIVETFTVTPR